ncbi:MAG: ABC transporter ATP-binding protein [Candidatus Carbobacillus altaicus]|uniref:ABC transporter, ATP-binding protein n=1 Tax=Candidatus Carbonibacillus altaicus TaxID=2163959 RepID=A0A2R6XXS0_9BACL|nr:ABC transporter ATP-binding protein [Candidatus Carbobacillus altaicus]PTQ55221.1 MAG: ABC transporter, ATP-binding protein [Candidatus Carbobacillus altaicus]
MEPLILVDGVKKSFQSQQVLQGVTFHLQAGEIAGLIGPNGAGKTTLIRIFNGLVDPDEGKVSVRGLDPFTDGNRVRNMTGTMTEEAGLYNELTGRENLLFFAKLYQIRGEDRVDELIRLFGLEEAHGKKVGHYSTGMKKRLSLAKVLLHQPEILLLDEPTNGLDPDGIQMILQFIRKLNQERKTTVLISSHILDQLETICHRYFILDRGKIISQGTKEELEEKYLDRYDIKVEFIPYGGKEFSLHHPFKRLSSREILISLPNKEAIPTLIRDLANQGDLYTVEILNRDLKTLYFKAREAEDE